MVADHKQWQHTERDAKTRGANEEVLEINEALSVCVALHHRVEVPITQLEACSETLELHGVEEALFSGIIKTFTKADLAAHRWQQALRAFRGS